MNTQMEKVNKKELEACLNCPICNNPFDQATTINECLHTFCKKCIDEKLREENPKTCPVCNVVIGETSPNMLSYDKALETLKNNMISALQKNQKMKTKTFAATQNLNSNAVHENEHNHEQSHVEKCVPESSENNKIATRNVPIWFTLMASDNNQDVNACLPQIPSKYLRVQDRNLSVLFIKKYIAIKLDQLVNENEIEICLRGQPLDSSQPLDRLIELWVETAPASERRDALVGSSAEDFVMILTYGRKI